MTSHRFLLTSMLAPLALAAGTAHAQIEDLIGGFNRLNQFGQASERQVAALTDRIDAAIAEHGRIHTVVWGAGPLVNQRYQEVLSASSSIVSRFRTSLQQKLKQDWARTQGDIRVDSGVPLSWLKGCDPRLSQQQFAAKWQQAGVWYVLVDGEGPRVCVPR